MGILNIFAKQEPQKKVEKILKKKAVVELRRTTDALTRKDLGTWRSAWQAAINVDNPDRRRLYDIYRDVEVDLHLSGCVSQRTNYVQSRSFKLVDKNGKQNDEATELLNAEWFKSLVKYALESIYWGHSLIELGQPHLDFSGKMVYDSVSLIPRKHVIPERNRVIKQVGDSWKNGIDYHEAPYCDWLIEVGEPDALGIYMKAALQTIPKKNAMSFWDEFAEIFGMPLRIAKTTTRDERELDDLESTVRDMGNCGYAVMPDGTEIEVVENSKGDAFNVYDRRIELADRELSKLVIGQTMTIEDGSSLSQSETHLKVFLNIVEKDMDLIRDIVNHQLLPRMQKHGFKVDGLTFDWDYSIDYTPEQQLAYETAIADRYEVDPQYFAEKYGMPVGQAKQPFAMAKGGDFFFG